MTPRTLRILLPLLALLAAAAGPVALKAQRGRGRSLLVVTVLDEQGRPLPHALVSVGGTDERASTNDAGMVRISGIPPASRLIEISRVGYAFTRIGADFFGRDTVVRVVRLPAAPIELDGITATTWGRSMRLVRNGFYDRQRRGLGAFMDAERLAWLRPFRTSDAFRYLRGFMVVPIGRGTQSMVVSTRGVSRQCAPAVYVDGAPMAGPQADALDMVPPQDLLAIEAYNGAGNIPAEYNRLGTGCGVILLWTRYAGT